MLWQCIQFLFHFLGVFLIDQDQDSVVMSKHRGKIYFVFCFTTLSLRHPLTGEPGRGGGATCKHKHCHAQSPPAPRPANTANTEHRAGRSLSSQPGNPGHCWLRWSETDNESILAEILEDVKSDKLPF